MYYTRCKSDVILNPTKKLLQIQTIYKIMFNKKNHNIKERQELDNMASTPFKFDHVGSFLRPESLKKARRDYEAGSITAEELKSVEDEAITELIKKEKEVGLKAITDGEFRRATWHLDLGI